MEYKAFQWLQNWYKTKCDGDWEHEYGIVIQTIDNPGWSVIIDLAYTDYENIEIPHVLMENSDTDWLSYSVVNKVFKAAGDPDKLLRLISIFKEIVESNPLESGC